MLLLAFAAVDYWFQRRQHLESLKMSRQEVKEERKMYEGDPLVRSRLRERMREIMRRNMLKAVPKADVVITNPTHYAIALEYDRASMAAPMVTAKGADLVAAKIREVAAEHRRAGGREPAARAGPVEGSGHRRRRPREVLRGDLDRARRGLPRPRGGTPRAGTARGRGRELPS